MLLPIEHTRINKSSNKTLNTDPANCAGLVSSIVEAVEKGKKPGKISTMVVQYLEISDVYRSSYLSRGSDGQIQAILLCPGPIHSSLLR